MNHSADHRSRFIGIDVGGTKIAAGLVEFPAMVWSAKRVIPTEAHRGGRAVLDAVVELANSLARESELSGQPIAGIGIGICELVDRRGELASANCIAWLDQPVREKLASIGRVRFEADVRAAAQAEAALGEGRHFENFLYVTIGTGISCCLMLGGRPFLGTNGFTGTMASSPLTHHCDHCGEVDERTLEEISAGPALLSRFNAIHGNATSSEEVVRNASTGHPIAAQIVRSAAEALGTQIGMLINVIDPAAVILGGGVGVSEGPYQKQLTGSIRRHIWSERQRDLPIMRAQTGADAGWIGSAIAAHRHFTDHSTQDHNTQPSATP